jgi:hypothetical protein
LREKAKIGFPIRAYETKTSAFRKKGAKDLFIMPKGFRHGEQRVL